MISDRYDATQLHRAGEEADKWFDTARRLRRGPKTLDYLVREGKNHIRSVERLSTLFEAIHFGVTAGRTTNAVIAKRVRKWKALVAEWEAAREGEVLPDAYTTAAEWFGTSKRRGLTNVVRPPYCGGGCRHSDVPREDRPRYCSEECQRAHWLAGHCHECQCTG